MSMNMVRRFGVMALAILGLGIPWFAGAAEVDVPALTNNTDSNANDVHITFTCSPGDLTESDPSFTKQTDTNPVDLKGRRGAVVVPGGTLELSFKHDCNPPPKVKSYYWTFDGKKIGNTVSTISANTDSGLTVISVPSAGGTLNYYLPSDVRSGDTISGTVSAVPDQPGGSVSSLSGVVLADQPIDGKPDGRWTVAIPAAMTAVTFLLKDDGGSPISVPVSDLPPVEAGLSEVPGVVQAGSPVEISGSFDGNLDTSQVEIANRPVELVAESPRGLFFNVPHDSVGPTELVLTEKDTTTTHPLRVVGISLSAGKLNLLRGETTSLSLSVTGLQNLDRPIEVSLVNSTPSVIRIQGGDAQTVLVEPGAVPADEDGVVLEFGLTGVQPGGFDVKASVTAGD